MPDPGELKLIMTKAEDGFDKRLRAVLRRAVPWEATAAGPAAVTCCHRASYAAACKNAQVVDNAAKCWITSGMEGQDGVRRLQLHPGGRHLRTRRRRRGS